MGAVAWAQSTTTLYTTDINGRRVEEISHGANDGTRTETTQSINGAKVPLEQSEEKVLRDNASGKVTERVVRKYDQTGRLTSTDRVLIEEQKPAGGGSHVDETTWRSAVHANMH